MGITLKYSLSGRNYKKLYKINLGFNIKVLW